MCRQIARYGPRVLVGLDNARNGSLPDRPGTAPTVSGPGFSPKSAASKIAAASTKFFAVDHAAAYKPVPRMEGHLLEAVENSFSALATWSESRLGCRRFRTGQLR
jgi:hypothetical protein